MRIFWLVTCTFFLCAADGPPPPEQLRPYIKEGRFDPGDYAWMRGHFDDASKAQKDEYIRLNAWLSGCFADARTKLKAELTAMGFANAPIDNVPVGPLLCRQAAHRPMVVDAASFVDFQKALSRAGPIAETFLAATALAKEIVGPRGPDLGDALIARPVREQMLRTASGWGTGAFSDVPQLAPDEKAILVSRLGMATAAEDYDNTEWLKNIVAERGWPKISDVGEQAAGAAWLLVQHADADPVFQLQALRLMEPLLKSGEVSRQNHAYLYDRIMLKVMGKQRYATQAGSCQNGKRQLQPLEDGEAVERFRREAGLPPLQDYMAQLDHFLGPCPN